METKKGGPDSVLFLFLLLFLLLPFREDEEE